MIDQSDQRLTWMIEASVSIYLYILLSLTNIIGENNSRDETGWLLVILTGSIVTINVLVFIWKSFWKATAFIKQNFPHLFIEKASKV
jgi:hypothetical protein